MNLKRLIFFLVILLLLALLSIYYPIIEEKLTGKSITGNSNKNKDYPKESAILTRVIDGDTIVVTGREIGSNVHIRLLGINTPEKNMPYSNYAINFLKQYINKTIELQRDYTDEDRYNRKLRYVYYDNTILNIEILEKGLATSFMLEGLKYKDKLSAAEMFAENNHVGLWKKSIAYCSDCIKLEKLDPIKDYFIINNSCDHQCDLSGWFVKDDANHFAYLDNLNPKEKKEYDSTKEIWNDNGDRFFMRDKKGDLVLFYSY